MKTTDWNYHFSSLPYWENRERIPFVFDQYFELPAADALCLIYSIAEVRMGDTRGFLAILQNKAHPRLLVNVTKFNIPSQQIRTDISGMRIYLQIYLLKESFGKKKMHLYIAVIDLPSQRFCLLLQDRFDLQNTLTEIDADTVHLSSMDAPVKLSTQKWFALDRFDLLPEIADTL